MGLSVGYGSIILEYAVRNIDVLSMFIAPLPKRSYVGLGLGYTCIILSRKCIIVVFIFVHRFVVMNIRMLIAPLPIWSYVGLGSRNIGMDMH